MENLSVLMWLILLFANNYSLCSVGLTLVNALNILVIQISRSF